MIFHSERVQGPIRGKIYYRSDDKRWYVAVQRYGTVIANYIDFSYVQRDLNSGHLRAVLQRTFKMEWAPRP